MEGFSEPEWAQDGDRWPKLQGRGEPRRLDAVEDHPTAATVDGV